jgi:hypothetical protein
MCATIPDPFFFIYRHTKIHIGEGEKPFITKNSGYKKIITIPIKF